METNEKGFFIFDTETSTLYNNKLDVDHEDQAWIVEFACIKLTKDLELIGSYSSLVQPPFNGATIAPGATEVHGITLEQSKANGIPYHTIYDVIKPVLDGKFRLVGHNLEFDFKFLHRFPKTQEERINLAKAGYTGICTMKDSTEYCKLPPTEAMLRKRMMLYKNPKLEELYKKLFDTDLKDTHSAMGDVKATHECLKELIKLKVITL